MLQSHVQLFDPRTGTENIYQAIVAEISTVLASFSVFLGINEENKPIIFPSGSMKNAVYTKLNGHQNRYYKVLASFFQIEVLADTRGLSTNGPSQIPLPSIQRVAEELPVHLLKVSRFTFVFRSLVNLPLTYEFALPMIVFGRLLDAIPNS
jgi:hypothetical protein